MSVPFKGTINVDIRDSVPDWSPFEPPKAPRRRAERGLHRARRRRVLGDGLLRRADRDAEHRPDRRRRCAVHAVAHHRAVLADALVPADRAQPHPQQHGVHHRGGDRVPRTPAARSRRRTATLSEILGEQGWNTVHGRQVAPVPRRRDEPRVDAAELADRPRLRALLRLPRRGDEPVVSGPRLRQPPGRPARAPRRRATTSPTTSPTRRSSSSATPRRSRPDKPFFLYYAPGACHAPHHAPKEWIDRYKGRFDMGYEAMREQTLARQKEMGIVPPTPSCRRSTRSARPRPAPGPTASRSRRWT